VAELAVSLSAAPVTGPGQQLRKKRVLLVGNPALPLKEVPCGHCCAGSSVGDAADQGPLGLSGCP